MAELTKLSELTRCPMRATAGNRFALELPDGSAAVLTPEQMQVAATVRVAEALERSNQLLTTSTTAATAQGELLGVLLAMSQLTAADVTPEFRQKLRQLYEQKGGRHGQ